MVSNGPNCLRLFAENGKKATYRPWQHTCKHYSFGPASANSTFKGNLAI